MDAVGPLAPEEITDPGDYCRAVERHLVQRNQGHLVRIVGPSFELVCGWAQQGVPLRVACRGIDRYVERQALKGPRRRPVRVEHCEADVLDVFDEWRRAIGAPRRAESDQEEPARHIGSLASHLERVVARLTAVASGAPASQPALAAKAQEIRHLLPPKVGGVLAILDGAPDADVLLMGHVGFDGLRRMSEIWQGVLVGRELRVRFRRVPRSDVPLGADDRVAWLFDAWLEMDGWIGEQLGRRALEAAPGHEPAPAA